jgi:hypothetical protein
VPGQPFAVGVTVIVAETDPAVLLEAVYEAMFPVPLAAIPIAVFVFVQAKVVPATGLVKLLAAIVAPSHTTILAGTTTVGVGFTVIV